MNESLAYILAVSLREIFPGGEIYHIEATPKCFFCDLKFPGNFTASVLSPIEERMRQWIGKQLPFKVLTMVPNNASEMLIHHGDKKLAQQVKTAEGEVSLLQLDRFFFPFEGVPPESTDDIPFFKLVGFWKLRHGIRVLGVGSSHKDDLKGQAQALKGEASPQNRLEEQGYVSWIGEQLVWETPAEHLKAAIKQKILEVYERFDEVTLPELDEKGQKKLFVDWVRTKKRGGVQFQKKRRRFASSEPWDASFPLSDIAWGPVQDPYSLKSYLHLITKFLTIFSFEYEIVAVGRPGTDLEKSLSDLHLKWSSGRGKVPRLEFRVIDRLGRRWTLSTLEWDRKEELVQVTLCVSFERLIALLVENKTLLNRLKQREN